MKPLPLLLLCACAHVGQVSDLDAAQASARKERIAGRWDDAVRRLDAALTEARRRGRSDAEARLLAELGHSLAERALRRGQDSAPALAAFERAHVVATGTGDRKTLAAAIDGAGLVYYWQNLLAAHDDWAPAESHFRDALALREQLGDARDLAASHFHLGLVHQMRGQREEAARAFARAGELAQKAGDPIELSYALRHQADLAARRGDREGARALHARSLALREAAGFTLGIANAHISLAQLEPANAEAHLSRAVELSTSIGDELTLGEAELTWAELLHSPAHARRAVESARRTHDVETEKAAAKLAATAP